jgi:hypothetical protein
MLSLLCFKNILKSILLRSWFWFKLLVKTAHWG